MKFVKAILILLLLAAAYVGGYGNGRWYGVKHSGVAGPPPAERKILYWVDAMHPSYKSDKPGIAPDCNMPLQPVYAEEKKWEPGILDISAERQQLIGVRYGVAEITSGSETILAPGKVAFDERGVVNVNSKVDGWIDRVFVDFIGKAVEKGQPLLTVYSPEMLATQQELLLAGQGQHVMRHSPIAEAKDHAASLVDAARRRLELWDFSPAQIDELLLTKKPVKTFTVYAPASGIVTARNAYANMRVTGDVSLYTLTDLNRVWILAELYEHDAPKIRVGQSALIRVAYGNGRAIPARVNFITPQMNGETRTLQVRLDAENPGQILKPEMFVETEFRMGLGRRLTVPSEAVLHSGLKQTVFVDAGEGKLLTREVEAGETRDGRTQILRGLKEGDRVVASGNFLLDSESKLKAGSLDTGEGKKTAAPAQGHVHD